jgi:hypothetical protein
MSKQLTMKKFTILLFLAVSAAASGQEIQKDLKHFSRIIASPRINVILKKGDQESIRLVYDDVSKNKINIEVKGRTLQIFLDDARKVEKTVREDGHHSRHGIYEGVSVTAYVTYTTLDYLEIRGTQELTCYDPIVSDEFSLKAYGENDITLASLKTGYFKASLYGENKLKIKTGKVIEQKYRLFGQNKIDTHDMRSEFTSTSIFGEGELKINTTEELRVNAFGEPNIYVDGGAQVNKRLVFGRTAIHQN